MSEVLLGLAVDACYLFRGYYRLFYRSGLNFCVISFTSLYASLPLCLSFRFVYVLFFILSVPEAGCQLVQLERKIRTLKQKRTFKTTDSILTSLR